jgi:hypothetical protein
VRRTHRTATAIVVVVLGIMFLASLAPSAVHHAVPTAVVPAGYCGSYGAPQKVTLVDQSGLRTYSVVCGDGVTMLYTH